MKCFDVHTHRPSEFAICSYFQKELPLPGVGGYCSVGIHPWFLEDAEAQLRWVAEAACRPEVLAVGECGLDKFASACLEKQAEVFQKCAEVSEKTSRPLIIHAVRCTNEMVRMKKALKPAMPWIIHGFRGKRAVAEELLRHGFYLSFGERFQPEALLVTPPDRLFLETDESVLTIESICRKAADIRSLSSEELAGQVWNNVQNVFFRR